jgi:hypothetical protein
MLVVEPNPIIIPASVITMDIVVIMVIMVIMVIVVIVATMATLATVVNVDLMALGPLVVRSPILLVVRSLVDPLPIVLAMTSKTLISAKQLT